MSRADELLWEINDALAPYYEEPFQNLFDAVEALLAQFLEEEEKDEEEDEEANEFSHGYVYGEPAQSMSALDREILESERQIKIWEEEENDELAQLA